MSGAILPLGPVPKKCCRETSDTRKTRAMQLDRITWHCYFYLALKPPINACPCRSVSDPDTWVTFHTGDMDNTFAPNGASSPVTPVCALSVLPVTCHWIISLQRYRETFSFFIVRVITLLKAVFRGMRCGDHVTVQDARFAIFSFYSNKLSFHQIVQT